MKKNLIIVSVVLLMLALTSVGIFYFQKIKKVGDAGKAIRPEAANETAATLPVAGDRIRILFVGDIMLDRWIRQVAEKHGDDFVFEKIRELLLGEDLVIGNLGGPITDKTSISVNSEFGSKENYIFTFPPQTSDVLSRENIKMVNLGNNHILNQGEDGLEATKKYLKNAGVVFFGDPMEAESIKFYVLSGLKIAFLNHNQFVADAEKKTLGGIKDAKEQGADVIILYTHWGTEFVPEPSQKIKNLAHVFVDAGADLIIGTHPHVVQTREVYKGKTIYYSLGNFIFDQYFSQETQRGMGVEAIIDPVTKKIGFTEYNFSLLKNGQTILK